MLMKIKNVNYIEDYKLELLFNNKKKKVVDFKKWIEKGGFYISPLKDKEYFRKVKLDQFGYGICWPNGADFSPDVLYENGIEEILGE